MSNKKLTGAYKGKPKMHAKVYNTNKYLSLHIQNKIYIITLDANGKFQGHIIC